MFAKLSNVFFTVSRELNKASVANIATAFDRPAVDKIWKGVNAPTSREGTPRATVTNSNTPARQPVKFRTASPGDAARAISNRRNGIVIVKAPPVRPLATPQRGGMVLIENQPMLPRATSPRGGMVIIEDPPVPPPRTSSRGGTVITEDPLVLPLAPPQGANALPLEMYSEGFRSKFPGLHAHSAAGVFVKGPDGRYRRFPDDRGTRTGNFESCESIGVKLVREIKGLADAPKDWVHETKAGYAVDAQGTAAWFEVGGRPVSSICEYPTTFPLPDRKWMIPQPDVKSCTYACEEMLLAEGKSKSEVVEQLRSPSCRLFRTWRGEFSGRFTARICASLKDRSGVEPLLIRGDGLTSPEEIRKLKDSIAVHGPCIFELNGHARILDAIEETAHGQLLTMRDPYPAKVVVIELHEDFWASSVGPNEKWSAIFLPKKQS